MRRRSRAGAEPAKPQRRKTGVVRKNRITRKVRPLSSSAVGQETKIVQAPATAEVLRIICHSRFDPRVGCHVYRQSRGCVTRAARAFRRQNVKSSELLASSQPKRPLRSIDQSDMNYGDRCDG
jgi:hypothetical protein